MKLCLLNCSLSYRYIAHQGQLNLISETTFLSKLKTHLFSQVLSWLPKICICHYFIKIPVSFLDTSMSTRLTSLHRLSNSFTNNDLDSIGYLFRLPFLLYCMLQQRNMSAEVLFEPQESSCCDIKNCTSIIILRS